MSNTKVIKNRINSVKNTQKITNAMYLIASTKLQKAKAEAAKARPFFKKFEEEIKRIFERRADVESRYFYPLNGRRDPETYAYLVITADKGLAGAYNSNVIKTAEEEMARHKNFRLYVVGEYGRHHFNKTHCPIEEAFQYTAQNPTFRRARNIASSLLMAYENDEVDEIRVIYSTMEYGFEPKVQVDRLLPFERADFGVKAEPDSRFHSQAAREAGEDFEFLPNLTNVLDNLIPGYVAGSCYGALMNSFCSEQHARMTAMSAANDNAEALMAQLSLEYNRMRQAAITQEITEVAAGAKAQKKKRKKEAARK